MSDLSTYPLRFPRSIHAGVERLSKQDGVSINQFVSIALAANVAMMQAQNYFAQCTVHSAQYAQTWQR